ncbi:hypothetical protein DL96DRAFT_1824399 [Flagelloscypha sp. PMI_526]|nr:hypothetical protein DL96DRAFT_1824399 [Flagelloscypha sp. PMI_526]
MQNLPFDVIELILLLVSDRGVLKQLTLVSRSIQAIADKILFGYLIVTQDDTSAWATGILLSSAICYEKHNARIISWRDSVKFFCVATFLNSVKHELLVYSILQMCPNIKSLDVAGALPKMTLQRRCPALTRLSCSFAPHQLGSILNSPLIKNITTLQPTYVSPDEWPLFINSSLVKRMPHLTQMALSGHALRVGQLLSSLHNIQTFLPSSFELLIMSVSVHVSGNDPAFISLMNGRVDKRFVACVPIATTEHRWSWALMKLIFEDKAEWVRKSASPEPSDFWEEARDLRDARNHALGL